METLKREGVYLLRGGLPRDLAMGTGEPQDHYDPKRCKE
jgi:hypothetical protein